MLSAVIPSVYSYPAVPQARQQVHHEAIPAFIYFAALWTVPKSPRWLILKLNKVQPAKKILAKIGGEVYAQATIEEIQRGVAKKESKGRLADIFSSRYATIMIIALGIAFFQQITGINAVFYYAPTIFEQAGGSTDSSFLQAIVVGLTNLVFTLVAIWLIDRLGRKPLLLIGDLIYDYCPVNGYVCI